MGMLQRAFRILCLDEKAIAETANDSGATLPAFLVPILGGILAAIGDLIWTILFAGAATAISGSGEALVQGGFRFVFQLAKLFIVPFTVSIALVIGVFILWLFQLIFGGKAGFIELLRPVGHAQIIAWFSVIPILGWIVSALGGIWLVIVNIFIVKTVGKLTTGKAILAVILPFVLLMILIIPIILFFLTLGIGGALLASMGQ